ESLVCVKYPFSLGRHFIVSVVRQKFNRVAVSEKVPLKASLDLPKSAIKHKTRVARRRSTGWIIFRGRVIAGGRYERGTAPGTETTGPQCGFPDNQVGNNRSSSKFAADA
ncbi:hypothetical protein V1478_016631, partial [Vespula squamosa]